MKFNMLENAMDSLNEAIDYYKNGIDNNDERCFKFCILLLSHSAELILKEILYTQHEILIYEDIDRVKNENDKTVGFKLALHRIKNIYKVDLGRYNNYLLELSDVRNNIQHYKFSISSEMCTNIITSSFSAIEYIIYNVLHRTFNDFEDIITEEQIEFLHDDKKMYNKKKKDIAQDILDHNMVKIGVEYIKNKFIYIPCPHCSEETLVNEGDIIECKFCGRKFNSIEDMYNEDFNCVISTHMCREIGRRKDVLRNIYECENCNNDTLIYSEVLGEWICLSCGTHISSITCDDCGDEVPNCEYNYTFAQSYTDTEDYMYLCNSCGKKLKDSEYGYCEYEIR
ncbi:hypothetical protein [Clostridium guangxiense]|uniref:hypothetical protein n=1 Tax=Clostridium guangxiense TaxID=1662055 RepID=UPI001E2A63E2|nr:hypothetical protein [Clostridium guangxiense]MCD2347244.1 hypothetical protein [Clostridium guangxiense]